MKHLLAVLFIALGMPAFSQTTLNWKPNYHWPLIDTVIEKGLPESALQLVDSIHQQAMVQKNELLQLKSSLYHIELKRSEDLNQDLYSILYLENELPNYHFPIRNLVQLKITQLYIKYTDNYSFEISKNSSNAFNKSAIESWPIEEFNTTILQNIQAIADPALKNSAISNYTEIIKKDETTVSNLYDFVAHELVQSIQNNRALLFWNMAHFNLKSDLMCSSQDVVKKKLPISKNKNQDSINEIIPLGVVLQLYQHLISNHLSDSSTELLIALDLERLAFVHENFTGDNEDNKYRLEIQKLL
jgi:hypothetical protein